MATAVIQQETDMTFPNPPVATARVDRITQRSQKDGATGDGEAGTRPILLRLVVALSPLVMAIW